MTASERLQGTRILVTGGAGFLGHHIVGALLTQGAEVTVFDSDSGSLERLRSLEGKRLNFRRGDITELEEVSRALRDVEAVIHLAAISDVPKSLDDPYNTFSVNCLGAQNVLESLRRSKVDAKFILSSSFVVYKTPPEKLPIDENHPLGATTPYGCSKLFQDQLTNAYTLLYGLRSVRLRLSPVFGPNQRPVGIMKMVLNALDAKALVVEGGKQSRDWNYVENAVSAFLKALASRVTGVFNVGGGTEVTVEDLASKITAFTGSTLPLLRKPYRAGEGEATRVLLDNKRANQVLGYEIQVPFDEGLRRVVAWARSSRPS